MNISQESSNRLAVGRHVKRHNKRKGRAHGGLMRGQKKANVGSKGGGVLPKNKGRVWPKRGGGKGWRQGWRKKGGKKKRGKGGDRQRNTITIQIQNPELYMEKLLEKFGRLEAVVEERLTQFKVKIMGTDPPEPGFLFILFDIKKLKTTLHTYREGEGWKQGEGQTKKTVWQRMEARQAKKLAKERWQTKQKRRSKSGDSASS